MAARMTAKEHLLLLKLATLSQDSIGLRLPDEQASSRVCRSHGHSVSSDLRSALCDSQSLPVLRRIQEIVHHEVSIQKVLSPCLGRAPLMHLRHAGMINEGSLDMFLHSSAH